jgi:hypothetical protein
MTLAILFAEDDSSDGSEDWDVGDLVYVEVDYDNSGTFTKVIQFATTAPTGSNFNVSAPTLDADFDGVGDVGGTELTPAFADFTVPLGTGNLVDIRITFDGLAAGDEDIALDNVRIIDGFVAAPGISITAPASGTVFAPGTTSVDVTWTTANLGGAETVDVTVNGSTTNVAVTATPYAVATTDGTTYNITVDLVDGGVLDTDTTDFSVGTLITVTDIAALRADVIANGLGRFYEITGSSLVTHTDAFRNRKWIEDTNISGVLIYDQAGIIGTAYAVGDLVSGLRGTTEEDSGVLRFVPTSDAGTIMSSGNAVAPQVVSITAFNAAPDDYESELIQLNNVTFVEGDGVATFGTGTNYTLSDGVDTAVKRTDFFSADYIGTVIPSSQLPNVVGVAGEFNGTSQIYVRSLADLTLSTRSFGVDTFNMYPNPTSTGFVNINSTNNELIKVRVLDVLGKQVLQSNVVNNKLNVSSLNAGIYILKLTQNNATVTKKLVIK